MFDDEPHYGPGSRFTPEISLAGHPQTVPGWVIQMNAALDAWLEKRGLKISLAERIAREAGASLNARRSRQREDANLRDLAGPIAPTSAQRKRKGAPR